MNDPVVPAEPRSDALGEHLASGPAAEAAVADLDAPPSGDGCVECLAANGWWLHLRRCAACGHVGCCDTSPSQHASRHAHTHAHPVAQSYEPDEDCVVPPKSWRFSYAASGVVSDSLIS